MDFSALRFDDKGLIPAIIVDVETSQVLIENAVTRPQSLVRVYANIKRGQTMKLGDPVRLTAETINCGENPRFQWQFSPDNITWTDVPGATASTLDIQLSAGNAAGYWRVGVTITD